MRLARQLLAASILEDDPMERDELVMGILEEKKAARRCAAEILAWVPAAAPFPAGALDEYVRRKLLLKPEDMRERSLIKLAKISVMRMSSLPRESAWMADAKDCAGATSSLTKKVLLMMAVEKEMGISMPPEASADIETMEDLAAQVALLRGEKEGVHEPSGCSG